MVLSLEEQYQLCVLLRLSAEICEKVELFEVLFLRMIYYLTILFCLRAVL